jgi:hypothetical protein
MKIVTEVMTAPSGMDPEEMSMGKVTHARPR